MKLFLFALTITLLCGCFSRNTKAHVIEENATEAIKTTTEKQLEYKYSNEVLNQIENSSFDSLKTIAMPDGTVKTVIYGGNKRIQSSNQISHIDTTKNEIAEMTEASHRNYNVKSGSTETAVNQTELAQKNVHIVKPQIFCYHQI